MDRKEAINALKLINLKSVHPFLSWEEMLEVRNMAIEALQEPEQPQVGGWIPVSERLPEEGYGVLVTVNGKHNNITFIDALQIAEYDSTDGWIIEGYLDWANPDVTAWQPLPEPFKESEEE